MESLFNETSGNLYHIKKIFGGDGCTQKEKNVRMMPHAENRKKQK